MRLSKIKLAGFKSFVDPTTIDLRSNLTGIVGPNGCGKSNTIDAVRWVMGESSAKYLRGDSMEDVIFNGSAARNPVGQASVELIFDNTDASLGGEYAKFAEIAIKRQVTRDGASKYFLNGSRCRRRDITDIFLGTGLGPRSYAIIEQGMISRLIEAKPEELRVYLEEAAGISKYRQRRRETENRIRHTRENLDRLSDLREEIDKHLKQLKRQANAAERYKLFKDEERRLEAELLLLRYQEIRDSIATQETRLGEQSTLQQQKIAELRATEAAIEEQRSAHTTANEKQNALQGEFYQLGAEISRIEQAIKHQQEAKARFEQQLQDIDQELQTSQKHLQEDQATADFSSNEIARHQESLQAIEKTLETSRQAYASADKQLTDWQTQWSQLQESIAQPTQQAQIERARMEQLERQIQQHKQRLERLQQAPDHSAISQMQTTVATHKAELQTVTTNYQQAQSELQQTSQRNEALEASIKQTQDRQNTLRARQQTLSGKLASLRALQQAALGKDQKASAQWLEQQGLADNPRLGESLRIEPGWEKALETVLARHIEAVAVTDLAATSQRLDTLPEAVSLSFYEKHETHEKQERTGTDQPDNLLLGKLQNVPAAVQQLLSHIYCAKTLGEARDKQQQLQDHESIICKDGTWLGKSWLQVFSHDAGQDSVLTRSKEISQLETELNALEQELQHITQQLEEEQFQLQDTREARNRLHTRNNELHREQSRLENTLSSVLQRIEQNRQQQQQREDEQQEIHALLQELEEEHVAATNRRNEAVTQVEALSSEKEQLQQQQQALTENVKNTRQQMLETQAQQQQHQLQIESLEHTLQQANQHMERARERTEQLTLRREQLLESQQHTLNPDENFDQQLETLLEQRKQSEENLQQARTQLQAIDHEIRSLTEKRSSQEQAVEQIRTELEGMKLTWQESSVRMKTLLEQFSETDYDLETLEKEITADASIKGHQEQLEHLRGRIQRLGAINLAAIDEYEQESERKAYLDQQNEDLMKALETLEDAIAKIDRDTRSLFKDTFDKVNSRIGEMFPRLFGGGKAYLEMTDNNLLTTGVVIMAQPPGKKISNIHLMSGGEKALTAAAMVFAIFELNPAPFCMLDEVDAPLDEANVRRFAELVKHMSERIQFIFITHNKTTMEVAENLIGVTMRELGVSRTVSVNVSDAVEMTQT